MDVSVLVDDREPSGLIEAVRRHADVEAVDVVRLPAGDVAVGDVGFERKTPGDYVNSALGTAGTDLHGQVRRMDEAYAQSYVLLEGDLADVEAVRPGVAPASIRGTMASFTARHDTPVLPCSDRERLVDVAVRLGRKHVEEPTASRLPAGTITGRTTPTTKRMYGCIEGVGPETADALYEAYPTVESLVSAAPEDLLAVDGVGEKRAAAIHAALRGGEHTV